MNGTSRQLVVAEWRKITTTKMVLVLVLVSLVFTSVQVGTLILVASGVIEGVPQAGDESLLMDPDYITTLIGLAGTAATFVLILGVIAMTGEYRHMTITSTFLSTPRRSRVLLAKLGVYGVLGAIVAALNVAVVTLLAAVAMAGLEHAPITAGAVGRVALGAIIGMAVYAVLGVSLGALIKSQVAAVLTAVLWVLLLEALVSLLLPAVSKWLPGGALNSAMELRLQADPTGAMGQADRLPWWGGIAVLLAYAAVLAALASRTTMRRDIT